MGVPETKKQELEDLLKRVTTSGSYESAKIANDISRLVEGADKKGPGEKGSNKAPEGV